MDRQRRQRKDQHIENYLKTRTRGTTLLDCVYIEHNALSDVSLKQIDTSAEFMGQKIAMPLMVDAITGGGDSSASINEDLSSICESINIPIFFLCRWVLPQNMQSTTNMTVLNIHQIIMNIP